MLETEKLLPLVIDKKKEDNLFNPRKIFDALMRETSISKGNAEQVTIDTTRFFVGIGKSVRRITAPMIREVVNAMLVKNGLEIARLEHTRVGISYYDFKELIHSEDYSHDKLLDVMIKEYRSVEVLKKKLENGG